MNLKKYLQQQADKEDEKILSENDIEFCTQLAKSVANGDKELYAKLGGNISGTLVIDDRITRNKFFWTAISFVLAVIVTVSVVLPVVLTKKPVENFLYKIENVDYRESNIIEVNSNLKYFELIQPEDTVINFELRYDTVSNDSLYYVAYISTEISSFNFYIVVNENYNYEFRLSSDLLSEQCDGYLMQYQKIENGDFTVNEINYKGVVQINTEIVYIDYTQTIGLGDQAFFSDVQNILKIKN